MTLKLFLRDVDIDWDVVQSNVQKIVEFDSFLRLNQAGSLLRLEAINSIYSIFRPMIFGIANRAGEFKVYERPVQEILKNELLNILKSCLKEKTVPSIELLQNRLKDHLDAQSQSDYTSENLETFDPASFTDESWRLIHLENGLHEVKEIQYFLKRISNSRKLTAEQEVSSAVEIEVGQFAQEFLATNNQVPDKERRELELLVLNGEKAFNLLFESSLFQLLGFAVYYRGRGLTILELIQEGSFGLIRAIHKFDHAKGYRFSVYATWWIRQSMTRAIADGSALIRVPVHRYEQIRKLFEIFEKLGLENTSQKLEPWELVLVLEELEIDSSAFKELLKSIWTIESIEPYLDSNRECIERVNFQNGFDLSANDPQDFYEIEEFERYIEIVLSSITYRESSVIKLRYGFDGHPRTLQEIGEVFDLTRERIRQIESKTMSKLRHPSRSEVLKEYLDLEIWPEGTY
jgi:RNA polymerase primary sigma factor